MPLFENCNFEYKEDKVTMQMLNLNTKTIEVNISFITSNDFRRLCPENSSKPKQHSRQQEAKTIRRRTAVSQGDFFWRVVTGTLRWLTSLHCLLYFLTFDWLRPAVPFFLKLDSLPIWKGKSYLKLSRLYRILTYIYTSWKIFFPLVKGVTKVLLINNWGESASFVMSS